jgi:hypothetical protein
VTAPPITFDMNAARAHVRAYTESFMDAQIIIRRGGRGTLDPATGVVSGMAGATEVYNGKARIHLASSQGDLSVGPGEFDQQAMTVSIPWASPVPQQDDVVEVVDGGADQTLNGNALRVLSAEGAGLFGDARRFQTVTWQESEYWTSQGTGYTP